MSLGLLDKANEAGYQLTLMPQMDPANERVMTRSERVDDYHLALMDMGAAALVFRAADVDSAPVHPTLAASISRIRARYGGETAPARPAPVAELESEEEKVRFGTLGRMARRWAQNRRDRIEQQRNNLLAEIFAAE